MYSPLALDAAIGTVASQQFGVLSLDQLRALGATADAIHRRVSCCYLVKLGPKAFRVAGAPRCWQQRALAAAFWVGELGAVALGTAAALHRLDGFGPPHRIEIVTTRSMHSHHLARVHRTPFLLPADRAVVGGVPATSIERTLIDVAGKVGEARAELALEDALRRRLTSPFKIASRLADLPANQPGRALLRNLLEQRGATPPAESALEVKVARMMRGWGYPTPVRQKVIDDEGRFVGRVDLVFPERRLIIEVDGFRHHDGRAIFDHDRSRRNALTALGWVVMHATSAMLSEPLRTEFQKELGAVYHRPL